MLDPFAGSGTTLVQALESGYDAVGVDIAAFNCLLMRVKTARYNAFVLERELRDALARFGASELEADAPADRLRRRVVRAAGGRASCSRFRSLIGDYEHADVLRVVLARAARSARLTTHFDLDFPRAPQRGPYWCHKHRRECRPVERAEHSSAATRSTRSRGSRRSRASVREGARRPCCTATRASSSSAGRSTRSSPRRRIPGLIDYHEQHRYAYELLGLDDRREREIGAAARGTSKAALAAYSTGSPACSRVARGAAARRARLIVVNDRRDLYPEILERAGLRLDERLRRHVNRRTGRRAGEYFEDVLVARA